MFYDWLETNPVSDSSIVLWHALMNISNKCGWKVEFAAAISTLSVKTGLKKDAIIRARLRLQQAGRIDFISRSGQLSALYKINCFDDYVVLNDSNRNTNRAQSATQTASIPKLNETKPLNVYEDPPKNSITNFSDLTKIELNNSIEYLDRVAQKKFTQDELNSYFEAFKIQYSTEFYHNRQKVINHFRDWLKKQKNGNSTFTNGNKSHSNNGSAAGAILLLNKVKQQFNT